MGKHGGFRRLINGMLFRRIGLVALVVASLMAIVAYRHSKTMVLNSIVQVTRAQMNTVSGRFREVMNRPGTTLEDALREAINYPPDTDLHLSDGKFVYALLHDATRSNMGIYRHGGEYDIAPLTAYIAGDLPGMSLPQRLDPVFRFVVINGLDFLEVHAQIPGTAAGEAVFLRAFYQLSEEAVHSIRDFTVRSSLFIILVVFGTALLIYPVILLLFERMTQFSNRLLLAHLETMEALGDTIAHRDVETGYHNYRVTIFTVYLAERIGISAKEMRSYIKGAFLHDIGKIGIRDEILLSEEKYSEEAREAMKHHVIYGLEIISRSSWLNDAADIVGSHHEKFDGSGYPAGLEGQDIPLAARVFALADVFDALTAGRPYKEPFSLAVAVEILSEGRGSHFDPDLFDLFLEIAEPLHQKFADREDDGLRQEYDRLVERFFLSDRTIMSK